MTVDKHKRSIGAGSIGAAFSGSRSRDGRSVVATGCVWGLLVAVCTCGCLSVPAGAMAATGDAASTAAFLHAANAFAQAQTANLSASTAAMEREASGMTTGCPSVLVGAPKGVQLSALAAEVVSAVLFSSVVPDRSSTLAFTRKIAALHWSDRTVAKFVRALAAEERAAVGLALPNVCADLVTWKTSGYKTLPSSTVAFLKVVEGIGNVTKGHDGKEESLEKIVFGRLRPYETPSDRQLAKRVQRLNEVGAKHLLSGYEKALSPLGKTLGLEPSEPS
jgi:hypothetical protein